MSEIRYAKRDDTHLALRVLDGPEPLELVMVNGFNFPIEMLPEDPIGARLLDGLNAIGSVVVFDRSGIGLSDPILDWDRPLVDQWSDDLATVIDAVGFTRPAVFSWEPFGVARRFAGRYPQALDKLILLNPMPSPSEAGDEWHDEFWQGMRRITSGEGDELLSKSFPTRVKEPEFFAWLDRAGKLGASPRTAERMVEATFQQLRAHPIDHSQVRVPTLVLRRPLIRTRTPEVVGRVAEAIPGAELIDIPGTDDLVFDRQVDALVAEIARFLTGEAHVPPPTRSLCAVLFTDLVSSTERAAELGDERWKAVLNQHDAVARTVIGRSGGRVVKTTGDGVLAVVPTASAALRASEEIARALASDGLVVRIGIHVAEIEHRDDDVAGLGVHVAARVMAAAEPGETYVSSTVPAVVAGGGFRFAARGRHVLKGVPGEWDLFAVEADVRDE